MENSFHFFKSDINDLKEPEEFTFPFFYTPHPLAVKAMEQVQLYLENQKDFKHNFGLNNESDGIGKMFGVLVVKNKDDKIGFLASFSGKLANSNDHSYFVPPVFDLLKKDGFFLEEENEINSINTKIDKLESSEELKTLQVKVDRLKNEFEDKLNQLKTLNKENKETRKEKRSRKNLSEKELNSLADQSRHDKIKLKRFKIDFENKINELKNKLEKLNEEIDTLKNKRKVKSLALQKKIFQQYKFFNALGEKKELLSIFSNDKNELPPAGSGECAAPKLLQYAFLKNFKPICMAEFWWGRPPLSEIRVHKNTYPACKGKCEPILNFMLQGLKVEPNPIMQINEKIEDIEILYESDSFLVVNKPPDLLSVPGKTTSFSLINLIREKYNNSNLELVHRLDMATSGIVIIAKNKYAYKFIQRQFIQRKIEKRYVAILDGVLNQQNGEISLPLRLDIDNRPFQVVCYKHGKNSITYYENCGVYEDKTRVYFYPKTGRTHQLRMHAAHKLGLNLPILGDDLYGKKSERLFLHATEITFKSPDTKDLITINCLPDF